MEGQYLAMCHVAKEAVRLVGLLEDFSTNLQVHIIVIKRVLAEEYDLIVCGREAD